MTDDFTPTQKRALAVLTVVALAVGAYFLREYLLLTAIAAVLAYLFGPLYRRCRNRLNVGLSATATLLAAIAIVAVPVAAVLFLAVVQISQTVAGVSRWVEQTDFTKLAEQLLDSANHLLARVPFLEVRLTEESVRDAATKVGQNAGQFALGVARDSAGGIASTVAAVVVFVYVFLALLTSGDKVVALFRDLNPLGDEVSDVYLSRVGAMVSATVKGQFIIAAFQGVAGAISVYIGGIHDGFFMFVIFLTVLSFIPLGGGIVTIPLGIGMAVFGNVAGGLFVVVFHFVVVSNIDNVLRPMLVPKSAHLHPALMLLAVFAGLKMFGFWGIVLGPVLVIVIVTTIRMYLAVYKDAPTDVLTETDALADPDDAARDRAERSQPWWRRLIPTRLRPDTSAGRATTDEAPVAQGGPAAATSDAP